MSKESSHPPNPQTCLTQALGRPSYSFLWLSGVYWGLVRYMFGLTRSTARGRRPLCSRPMLFRRTSTLGHSDPCSNHLEAIFFSRIAVVESPWAILAALEKWSHFLRTSHAKPRFWKKMVTVCNFFSKIEVSRETSSKNGPGAGPRLTLG